MNEYVGWGTEKERRWVASHETGHCVVATAFGYFGAIEMQKGNNPSWNGQFVLGQKLLTSHQNACVSAGGLVGTFLDKLGEETGDAESLAWTAFQEWEGEKVVLSPSDLAQLPEKREDRFEAVSAAAVLLIARRVFFKTIVSHLMTAEVIRPHQQFHLLDPVDASLVATTEWLLSVGFRLCDDESEYDLMFSDPQGFHLCIKDGKLVKPADRAQGFPQYDLLHARPTRGEVRGHLAERGVLFPEFALSPERREVSK